MKIVSADKIDQHFLVNVTLLRANADSPLTKPECVQVMSNGHAMLVRAIVYRDTRFKSKFVID